MTAFTALFTGQGSQFPGMGRQLYEASGRARAILDRAEEALPGLRRLCFEGPEEELVLTENTQPCLLAVDLAAYEALGRRPACAAGHSLGEYAALVAAGSLDLETALPLVRDRGRAMQEAVPPGRGGMVVLRKVDLAEAKAIAASVESGVCDLANLNAPGQYVLSGETAAMDELVARFGGKASRLPVSVPFHSSLLAEAGRRFAERLREVELRDPAFPILCNVDARPVRTAPEVRDALERQFAGPVLWEPSLRYLLKEGRTRFIEFGPKATLSRMALKIGLSLGIGVQAEALCKAEDLARLSA